LEGINQVQRNPDIELTFATTLKTFLRQDPDVIMVGEIRDLETAEISMKAASTGHLVVSTLHTNDAPSTITRMKDMGIPTFMITATVEAILAQRLVRRICSKCREETEPPLELLQELGVSEDQSKQTKFYKGKGCDNCNNTGYKGRIGLFELMVMNDDLREMILRNVTTDELRNKAVEYGMITLRDYGKQFVFQGHTTAEEVVRETVHDG